MFDDKEQILDFLKSNNIEKYIDYNNLYDAKIGVFTHGTTINKVWVDSVTYCVTAYKTDAESKFTEQYASYMNSLEPLGFGDGVKQLSFPTPPIPICSTIDDILDKINLHGIESLTEQEKNILNSHD